MLNNIDKKYGIDVCYIVTNNNKEIIQVFSNEDDCKLFCKNKNNYNYTIYDIYSYSNKDKNLINQKLKFISNFKKIRDEEYLNKSKKENLILFKSIIKNGIKIKNGILMFDFEISRGIKNIENEIKKLLHIKNIFYLGISKYFLSLNKLYFKYKNYIFRLNKLRESLLDNFFEYERVVNEVFKLKFIKEINIFKKNYNSLNKKFDNKIKLKIKKIINYFDYNKNKENIKFISIRELLKDIGRNQKKIILKNETNIEKYIEIIENEYKELNNMISNCY